MLKFKVFYFDIGLAQRLLGLDIKQWLLNPGPLSNQGAIAEQFVAQELLAYSSFKQHTSLYYWHREAKSSCAEVDFLLFKQGQLVPVEVKSSKKGSMKSMHLFLEEHNHAKQGLKISEGMFAQNGAIEEIPFYAIEDWLQN